MNAIEIIEAIRETALNDAAVIDALNDGAALATLGVTDADQGAVEDALALMIGGSMELATGKTITLSGGFITAEWDDGEPADLHHDHARDLLERLGLEQFSVKRITWVDMGNEHNQSGHWQVV